ncbi:helix-turn-helix domain-containing protein [Pedobacter jeongneungensis]|uniref:helix-turn-helix domain-containing protein n=1 Tax=Pedobacter jeongneungensis TaxID=947309 RepID=UPI00046ACD3F|nr:helix-turn-helix domain-containing protein [Pedobacter jeongneungensis]
MSIHIGLLIWKEMKAKSISREELAAAVNITKHRVGTLLKSASVDTEILKRISIKLCLNFFEYYRKDEDLARFEVDTAIQNHQELNQLKALIKEKNRLLELCDETIKSQKKIIASLENLRKL